jgi:hypothetical protein
LPRSYAAPLGKNVTLSRVPGPRHLVLANSRIAIITKGLAALVAKDSMDHGEVILGAITWWEVLAALPTLPDEGVTWRW